MFFKYNAIDLLTSYEEEHFDFVRVCCYSIFLNDDKPFLSYLTNLDKNDNYNFPLLENNIYLHEKIIEFFSLKINQNIHFRGFIKYKNELLVFYELKEVYNEKNEKKEKNENYKKCLIYEILNTKQINNYPISDTVIDFFTNNQDFCYLYNFKNEVIEIPIVAFQIVHKSMSNYIKYSEILLETNYDFYKLSLVYQNKINFDTLRYAVFLNIFISINDLNEKPLDNYFNSYNSIINSKSKTICFQHKSQQKLL